MFTAGPRFTARQKPETITKGFYREQLFATLVAVMECRATSQQNGAALRAESGFFFSWWLWPCEDLSRTNTQEKLPPLVSPLSRRFYFGALQCKLWESHRPSCFIPSKSSTGPFPVGAIFLRRGAILNISPDLTALVRAGREWCTIRSSRREQGTGRRVFRRGLGSFLFPSLNHGIMNSYLNIPTEAFVLLSFVFLMDYVPKNERRRRRRGLIYAAPSISFFSLGRWARG